MYLELLFCCVINFPIMSIYISMEFIYALVTNFQFSYIDDLSDCIKTVSNLEKFLSLPKNSILHSLILLSMKVPVYSLSQISNFPLY